jgi:hypothetical protein
MDDLDFVLDIHERLLIRPQSSLRHPHLLKPEKRKTITLDL